MKKIPVVIVASVSKTIGYVEAFNAKDFNEKADKLFQEKETSIKMEFGESSFVQILNVIKMGPLSFSLYEKKQA